MINHMKRTTLILDERSFSQIKQLAAKEGRTLSSITDELLREGLARRQRHRMPEVRTLPSFSMGRPVVDLADRDRLYEEMERG